MLQEGSAGNRNHHVDVDEDEDGEGAEDVDSSDKGGEEEEDGEQPVVQGLLSAMVTQVGVC